MEARYLIGTCAGKWLLGQLEEGHCCDLTGLDTPMKGGIYGWQDEIMQSVFQPQLVLFVRCLSTKQIVKQWVDQLLFLRTEPQLAAS